MIEVIADIGSSHNGNLGQALDLIDAVGKSGANVAKFQVWERDGLWRGDDARCETTNALAVPRTWLPELYQHCLLRDVEFLVTPFSPNVVDWLEELDKYKSRCRYKIASGDITYTPLLERVSKTGRPVILSCGFSTQEEIEGAIETLRPTGECDNLTLLHCVGAYPTRPEDAEVTKIIDFLVPEFAMKLNCKVGLSSHVSQWWCDIPAIAYHISTIEKHIKLDDDSTGPEAGHALPASEFKKFVSAVRDTEKALKKHDGFCTADKLARRNYRRDPSDWLRPNL